MTASLQSLGAQWKTWMSGVLVVKQRPTLISGWHDPGGVERVVNVWYFRLCHAPSCFYVLLHIGWAVSSQVRYGQQNYLCPTWVHWDSTAQFIQLPQTQHCLFRPQRLTTGNFNEARHSYSCTSAYFGCIPFRFGVVRPNVLRRQRRAGYYCLKSLWTTCI